MSTPENIVALGCDKQEAAIRPLSNAEIDTTSGGLVGAAILFSPDTVSVGSEKTKAVGKQQKQPVIPLKRTAA